MPGYRERVIYDGILEVHRDSWEIHYSNDAPRRGDGQFDLRFVHTGRSLQPQQVKDYAGNLVLYWQEAERIRALAGGAPGEFRKWLRPCLPSAWVEVIVTGGRVLLHVHEVCPLQSGDEAQKLAAAFRDIIARAPQLQEKMRALYGTG